MLKVTMPGSTVTITCPFDTSEPKAQFEISDSLSNAIRGKLQTRFAEILKDESFLVTNCPDFWREVVKVGTRAITNVKGLDFNLEPDGSVTESTLEAMVNVWIPGGYDTLIIWLGVEIWKVNMTDPDAKKNSDSPSSPAETSSPTQG